MSYDDEIPTARIPPTVDRQTKESSHPAGRHRVKPGKELVTTDRLNSIVPVTPPIPRASIASIAPTAYFNTPTPVTG